MKIGNLDIGNKLILAPMAEITDSAFRIIAKEHGAGLTFTQMVSADGIRKGNFETLRRATFHRSEKPIGIQLLANDPLIVQEAIAELSGTNPDIIDLNCGCPVHKVVSVGMGSCILDDPVLLGKLVAAMSKAANGIPVSVKLRLGTNKNKINILEVAKIAEDNGASLIFVHAKTKQDRASGKANWEWIGKVKEYVSIPVVGNGSVFSPEDAKQMLDETGCDSVMVARGALGNPFIFERFNILMEKGYDPGPPEIERIKLVALKHINLLIREYGEISGVDKAKKHIIWYFKNSIGIRNLLDEIFLIHTKEELVKLLNSHTEKIQKKLYQEEDLTIYQQKFNNRVLFWLLESEKLEKVSSVTSN